MPSQLTMPSCLITQATIVIVRCLKADLTPRHLSIHRTSLQLIHILFSNRLAVNPHHTMTSRNRKQRRAAAAAAQSSSPEPDIPLATPPRDEPSTRPRERTLYDIIAERQNELLGQAAASQNTLPSTVSNGLPAQPKGTRFVTVNASGQLVDTDGDLDSQVPANIRSETPSNGDKIHTASESDQPLPPLLDTILLSLPLTTLHCTLAYLAAHQYAESVDIRRLLQESLTITLPLLTFLVHFAHGHIVSFRLPKRLSSLLATQPVSVLPLTREKLSLSFIRRLIFPPSLRTMVFLPIAALLGAHLISITNGEPYYAVMKKAPAVGTMWIWCILEMSFGAAFLGAIGPLVWGVWWMGYGIV